MKFLKSVILLMGVAMLCNGCSHQNIQAYKDNEPHMYVRDFFTGSVKAWGIVQDRKGLVVRRFQADLYGIWTDDGVGKLAETFHYDDGEIQDREWVLKLEDEGSFSGTAGDIVGTAQGRTNGNALFLNYVMTVPVGNKKYNLKFDDRMWLIDKKTLMNKAVIKKFGIRVAELTVFMQKQDEVLDAE